MILSALASLVLVSLWVAAWLHWFFVGEVRHFLFAWVFPEGWRSGYSRQEIMFMNSEEFDMFLVAESQAPGFIRGVLACPGCLSAHISAVGTALAFFVLILPPFGMRDALLLTPLLWASSAWVGHRLHHRL